MSKLWGELKKLLLSRMFITGLIILLQVIWFVIFFLELTSQSWWIDIVCGVISVIALLSVINTRDNPAYKLAWAVPIALFPLFGGLCYVLYGHKRPSKGLYYRINSSFEKLKKYVIQDKTIMEELWLDDKKIRAQALYINDCAGFPIYKNTTTKYYKSGEECFKEFLDALRSAKHFIFMEYFIVSEGKMWDAILEVLKEKAMQGVEVRFMYDDMGCVNLLEKNYYKELEKYRIQSVSFNRLVPTLAIVMNNRDHRKITVIDGYIGFTGGINIADEYINEKSRFGYWKDCVIKLEGEAVWNMTVMFMNMWNSVRREYDTQKHIDRYMPHYYHKEAFEADGYVQPYGDSPLDNEAVGENVYLNMMNAAEEYLYMFTPYLIIDNEMITALSLAAKRGVDVRIVTPGIPDKKLVFMLTRSYYSQLIDAGVKIYEYTPGFIHSKVFVCDDRIATVGTINMDFRSLYLHFECGVLLCKTSSIMAIKQDALDTFEVSRQVTKEEEKNTSSFIKLVQAVLRMFAPLV